MKHFCVMPLIKIKIIIHGNEQCLTPSLTAQRDLVLSVTITLTSSFSRPNSGWDPVI